jgi:hypothetical protein
MQDEIHMLKQMIAPLKRLRSSEYGNNINKSIPVQEKTKRIWISGNACYDSMQYYLSSGFQY